MIIIAFSTKTSKIIPKILCRHFRHVAPIVANGDCFIMYQFVRRANVAQIKLGRRDLSRLAAYGWKFIYVPYDAPPDFDAQRAYTCVDLTKRICRIHAPFVQTPDALWRFISPDTIVKTPRP